MKKTRERVVFRQRYRWTIVAWNWWHWWHREESADGEFVTYYVGPFVVSREGA